MKFSETLRNEMKYHDLRSKELAEQAGISLNTINHYLAQSSNTPSAENAFKIAQALGVSVEYLMTGKNADIGADIKPAVRELIPQLNYLADEDLSLIKDITARLKKN